jgi:hypothetical protein
MKPAPVKGPLHQKSTGARVEQLQVGINRTAAHWKLEPLAVEVDGDCGSQTLNAAVDLLFALGAYGPVLERARNGILSEYAQQVLRGSRARTRRMKALSLRRRRKVRQWRKEANPLRERAYRIAASLIGVMEEGGNNAGRKVGEIIRSNGGAIGEPWCGDFVAYCYRNAGSKSVTRSWAAVRLLSLVSGVKATTSPQPGDLVRFTFDHVGMFVRDLGNGEIETIEGNTGASGAVSDSATGGDGVYRKQRSKSLVNDYLRVTR